MTVNSESKSQIKVIDRNKCEIEGVKKLDSFDSREFFVDTSLGYLHIKGKDLSLGTMDMNNGVLSINGTIDSISYITKNEKDKETSLLKKLFK